MGAVCFLLMVVGTAGYLTFGDAVDSNVLFSYPHDSMFVVLALVGIIVDVLSSYPLLMFMTRISISNLLTSALRATGCSCLEYCFDDADIDSLPGSIVSSRHASLHNSPRLSPSSPDCPDVDPLVEEELGPWQYAYVVSPMSWSDFISNRIDLLSTALIMIFTVSVAPAVSDLGIVAALTGATGATMIGYVVPGLLYVLLLRKQMAAHDKGHLMGGPEEVTLSPHAGVYAGAMAMLVLGCVLVPAGVTLTLTRQ